MDQVMPSVAMDFPSPPTFTRTVESGTCFRQTRNFMSHDLLVIRVHPGDPHGATHDRERDDRADDPCDGAGVEFHRYSPAVAAAGCSSRAATNSMMSTGFV